MKRLSIFFAAIVTLIGLAGCAGSGVSAMSGEADARAKSLQAPSDKALVYVVRATLLGKPFPGYVTANDQVVGTTLGRLYVYAILPPGDYKFKVTGQDSDSEVALSVAAGKTYFVRQNVYPGIFKGLTSMDVLDEQKGREDLKQCELSSALGKNVAN